MTTEWEDIQVRMGNWLPREPVPSNEDIAQAHLESVEQIEEFKGRSTKVLDAMAEDHAELEDDDEYLEAYRKKRLEEMLLTKDLPRFGMQLEI